MGSLTLQTLQPVSPPLWRLEWEHTIIRLDSGLTRPAAESHRTRSGSQ
jgi:hypothetical protein